MDVGKTLGATQEAAINFSGVEFRDTVQLNYAATCINCMRNIEICSCLISDTKQEFSKEMTSDFQESVNRIFCAEITVPVLVCFETGHGILGT
jgi:hypothetical protein